MENEKKPIEKARDLIGNILKSDIFRQNEILIKSASQSTKK